MECVQLSFIPMLNVCENCTYFKVDEEFHSIDCLNRKIGQEDYFKYLGEGEKGCPYYKERE